MKKFIVIVLLMLTTSFAFAIEETMVTTDKGYFVSGMSRIRTLTLLCTADSVNAGFSLQLSDSQFKHIKGWMITEVRISNSTAQTDPTINSDVSFTLVAGGFDLLYDAGLNMLDNDVVNQFVTEEVGTSAWPLKVVDQFYVEVANNSVNSAIFNILLIAIPSHY